MQFIIVERNYESVWALFIKHIVSVNAKNLLCDTSSWEQLSKWSGFSVGWPQFWHFGLSHSFILCNQVEHGKNPLSSLVLKIISECVNALFARDNDNQSIFSMEVGVWRSFSIQNRCKPFPWIWCLIEPSISRHTFDPSIQIDHLRPKISNSDCVVGYWIQYFRYYFAIRSIKWFISAKRSCFRWSSVWWPLKWFDLILIGRAFLKWWISHNISKCLS